jgi:hypothetical protein
MRNQLPSLAMSYVTSSVPTMSSGVAVRRAAAPFDSCWISFIPFLMKTSGD